MVFKNSKVLLVFFLLFLFGFSAISGSFEPLARNFKDISQTLKPNCQIGDSGSGKQQCCDRYLFKMNGYGKISASPDIAKLSVSFQEIGKTTQEASQALNRKVNSLLKILTNARIQQKDISTNAVNVYPRYNYENGNSVLIGYAAYQNFVITLRNIGANGSGVGSIIDKIAVVDGIRVDNIAFDLENKTNELLRAREAAFNDALTKAKDYASFSNTKVGKVVKIEDYDYQVGSTIPANGIANKGQAADSLIPSVIIADNLTISTNILITFQIIN